MLFCDIQIRLTPEAIGIGTTETQPCQAAGAAREKDHD
jgi:hypothetical protein